MVYIQEFASAPDRNFVGHEVVFRDFDTGEKIKRMSSRSSLPIPREGENVLLAESKLTVDDGPPAWSDDQREYPESDDDSYRVAAVEHEYAFIEPDEEAESGYESGQAVFTDVLVAEVESDLPV